MQVLACTVGKCEADSKRGADRHAIVGSDSERCCRCSSDDSRHSYSAQGQN